MPVKNENMEFLREHADDIHKYDYELFVGMWPQRAEGVFPNDWTVGLSDWEWQQFRITMENEKDACDHIDEGLRKEELEAIDQALLMYAIG